MPRIIGDACPGLLGNLNNGGKMKKFMFVMLLVIATVCFSAAVYRSGTDIIQHGQGTILFGVSMPNDTYEVKIYTCVGAPGNLWVLNTEWVELSRTTSEIQIELRREDIKLTELKLIKWEVLL
jgi:hypothetical protein